MTKTEDLPKIVDKAREAQKGWAGLSPKERSRFILKAKDYLVAHQEEVAQTISQETGKPPIEALVNEVAVILDAMTYYGRRAEKFLRTEKTPLHSPILALTKKAYTAWEPVGVVAVIGPWNYPFSLALYPAFCALLAGNAVILKPSSLTPKVSLKIREIFADLGLPEGLFEVIIASGGIGQTLIESDVNKIHFTGSVDTGRRVADAAAKKLTPVILELGGSDPMIILEDANLERAANALCWGRFSNAGQTCIAPKRVFVAQSQAQKFKEILKTKIQACRLKPAASSNGNQYELGPLINEEQLAETKRQLDAALADGAKILQGGERRAQDFPLFAPTVVETQNQNINLLQEETFGPLLPIMTFKTEDEAIRLANNSNFGLAASIFSRDKGRALTLAKSLEAGSVLINDVLANFAATELPFGGIKQSGLGFSHGGAEGLRSFCRPKSILADRWGLKSELYWFPYSEGKYKFFAKLFKLLYGKFSFWG